ncbi:NlpC/P60 family protein [Streptomyces sp. NPDC005483]|uniref:C40 family peptidase n=1 Tax=Streptomyces sp. NPDC005483 TaxID=3154882 RepID=UPI0033A8B35D
MNVSTCGKHLRSQATIATLVCAIFSLASPSYAAPIAPIPGSTTSIGQIRTELDALYHQAEVATEAYDDANEKATKQERRLVWLRKDRDRAEDRVDDLHDLVGAAARAQYRGGGIAAAGVQLLLGDNSDQALHEASQSRQLMRDMMNASDAQASARAELAYKSDAAAEELYKLLGIRSDKMRAKRKIEGKIAAAKRIEAGLKIAQKRKLARMEKAAAHSAEAQWGAAGFDRSRARVIGSAAKAVDFAMTQIGKPYVWGAVGPASYDCSGLTSRAWAVAGNPIPRTSQSQWHGLTRVSLALARPGDLIIYFSDATHVGIYIGHGKIVHAPRPGRTVTIAPAASMPILGVVRPGV